LTLGNVYDLDLKRNEKIIKDVIIQAQGEVSTRHMSTAVDAPQMALEEFLKQVKETWTTYSLDLTNYQNKCRLIRFVTSLKTDGY
jgi:dynein heavy chain 1